MSSALHTSCSRVELTAFIIHQLLAGWFRWMYGHGWPRPQGQRRPYREPSWGEGAGTLEAPVATLWVLESVGTRCQIPSWPELWPETRFAQLRSHCARRKREKEKKRQREACLQRADCSNMLNKQKHNLCGLRLGGACLTPLTKEGRIHLVLGHYWSYLCC